MKAVFLDIHIHTSENPNKLNDNYDVMKLMEKVKSIVSDNPCLLSLTDHNTINKDAYMKLVEQECNVIVGAELHIKKYDEAPPYHCHILFNVPVEEGIIDRLNEILDELYPDKEVQDSFKNVPNIEMIANKFDSYDFILLPHGGQSHRTFDKATAKGHRFDTSLEKSLYYNHFEGFTARSNTGLTETVQYFERLGIDQFINLVTCTDNYNPSIYPSAKSKEAEPFIPTWIFSEPSFEGLRLALSEKSRIVYGERVPESWEKTIHEVELHEENCDIDVKLESGLNVVIGGSSSGKTLFVDSLVKSIKGDFGGSKYEKYNVANMRVDNPSGIVPHYINQNFIMSVFQNEKMDIGDIDVIKEVFPEDDNVTYQIRISLSKLKRLIEELADSVEKYEKSLEKIKHIASPAHLIIGEKIPQNIPELLKGVTSERARFNLEEFQYDEHIEALNQISRIFTKSKLEIPFIEEIETLKKGLKQILGLSQVSKIMMEVISSHADAEIERIGEEQQSISKKLEQRSNLTQCMISCLTALNSFYETKKQLAEFNVNFQTREIKVCNHKLSIENHFTLTSEVLVNAINTYLKSDYRVAAFEDLKPENLFKDKFSDRPKVDSYSQFANKVYDDISHNNRNSYKIVTSTGVDFDDLSPGWKSAIILDLILGYSEDIAPLIIDQPEDNLATDYINHGLINQIKTVKSKKQIILVSHNATIPMLGDAQCIVVCSNNNEKIDIKAAHLESEINGQRVLDLIAKITDGGKPSIRKRVKKYDLKRYKES
ncbi:MAG: hypothetical protein ACI4LZ_04400 [Anaerovoracaceae bacterium]